MTLAERCDRLFDRLAVERLPLPRGHSCPAFRACGLAGFGVALALAMLLVARADLSLPVMGVMALCAVAVFLIVVIVTTLATGEEQLVYYHAEIAIVLVATILLRMFGGPVLPYLDITALGVGAFLACGRVGCLMVGCCHGRPSTWGVRYTQDHVAAGFPAHYAGVRLFPVQLAESLWVGGVTLGGAALVLRHAPPGAALAWYVVAYDIGRFGFELARGDHARRYLGGFSEAQWTALLLTWLIVWAEQTGVLPPSSWHLTAATGLLLVMALLRIQRAWRGDMRWALFHPRHVREIARALRSLAVAAETESVEGPQAGAPPRVVRTSLGLALSSGIVERGGRRAVFVAFSTAATPLADGTARGLARLVARLFGAPGATEVLSGSGGVYHVILSGELARG